MKKWQLRLITEYRLASSIIISILVICLTPAAVQQELPSFCSQLNFSILHSYVYWASIMDSNQQWTSSNSDAQNTWDTIRKQYKYLYQACLKNKPESRLQPQNVTQFKINFWTEILLVLTAIVKHQLNWFSHLSANFAISKTLTSSFSNFLPHGMSAGWAVYNALQHGT